jgi:methylmalonyl-CoA mutase
MYPNMTEELLDPKPEDREAEKKVLLAAVEAYRKDIDEKFLKTALDKLQKSKKDEVIDNATTAFVAGATIGEVWKTFARSNESIKIAPIAAHHWTERFEVLRMDTEKFKKKTGKNVEVFLANMGPIPQHKARADFSTSFLQVGEFNVNLNDGFKDDKDGTAIEKCCKAAAEKPYDCAVICSTDATYPEIVPALAPKLKAALPKGATLFLAGAAPKDLVPGYKAAGIDDFISVSANCYEILRMLQKKKGMIE